MSERRRAASIGSITTTEIERFRAKEVEDGKTVSTVNTEMAVLRAVFSSARRQGLTSTNPVEAVEKMYSDSEEKEPFTEDQFKALVAVAPNTDWKGMMILGWNTGIRIADAANITWDMIDLTERSLSFYDRKSHARKRTQDKRTIVGLHKDVIQFLASLPGSDDPHFPLFPTLHGMKAGSHGGLSNAFRRIMKTARIRQPETQDKKGKGRKFNALSFHSFRHSFVSRGANHNIPSDVRKKMVGHTSDAVHARYTKLTLKTQLVYLDSLPSSL